MSTPPLPTTPATLPGGALPLADWGVIRARGEDAAAFLQGQLTQDVLHLLPGQARLAGYCSAKGRLLASFWVWSPTPGEYLLACSADLLPTVLKRLSMFVLRARCKLTDASAELPLWGVAGVTAGLACGLDPAGASLQTTSAATAIRLPDALLDGSAQPRWLLAGVPAEPAPPVLAADAWRALEVLSGVPRVVAATSEQFVPQMINLELVGGVNFQKGCYPGQEVVARSQYRGTLKRRAFVLHSAVPLQPAQELFHSADPGQPAGQVVLAGSLGPGQHVALAELKIAALAEGSLHAGSADGPPLTVGALPYTLPSDVG